MMRETCPHCQMEQDLGLYQCGDMMQCLHCRATFRVKMYEAAPSMTQGNLALATQRPAIVVPFQRKSLHQEKKFLTVNSKLHQAGFSIDGYELKECRGRGGMGQVYRAIQKSLGREVAIKTLDTSLARNQASIMRFTKEAAAMACLTHPNIVQVIDRGTSRQRHYFVMEYVDGPSLRDLLKDGVFSPNEALRIMLQIARTMEYAHIEGVIHRDLKPENILYTNTGVLKVADFGLAGVEQETTHIRKLTKSFVSMGTECYMAPEQRRDAKNVDQRADIYSMGVILYELVSNQIPMSQPTPEKPMISKYPHVDTIVRRCLKQSPKHRYSSTSELCEAIEKAMPFRPSSSTDTLIDEPSILIESHNKSLQWTPHLLRSSFNSFHHSWVHFTNRIVRIWHKPSFQHWLQKGLWSSGIILSITLFVGLFFLLSPRPPQPKSILTQNLNTTWKKHPATIKSLPNRISHLTFPFKNQPLRSNWGRHPRYQWTLKGNWFVENHQLEQNTYVQTFLRNHRNCWAIYEGHKLSPNNVIIEADIEFLQPLINVNKEKIPLQTYLKQELLSGPSVSRNPRIGIGVKGNKKQEIAFLLRPRDDRWTYILRSRTGTSSHYRLYPGILRTRFHYNSRLHLALKWKGNLLGIWVNQRKVEEIEILQKDAFASKAGLLCRDAHCRFDNFTVSAHAVKRAL